MPLIRAVLVGLVLVLGLVLLTPAQRFLAHIGRSPDRAIVLFCRTLLLLLGVRVIGRGEAAGDGAPRLVVANHVSWIDILALGSVEPLCFLAKQEVADWPLVGGLASRQGTVFIDRRRRRRIVGANAALAARLGQGRSILLFPEGTTHDGRRRGRFLTAHLACLADRLAQEPATATVAVQAVGLAYSDPGAAWIGTDTLLPHAWALLKRPGLTCRLAYGTPLRIARGFDRKALGRRLASDVEALLAEERPLRESLADARPATIDYYECLKAGQPGESA